MYDLLQAISMVTSGGGRVEARMFVNGVYCKVVLYSEGGVIHVIIKVI